MVAGDGMFSVRGPGDGRADRLQAVRAFIESNLDSSRLTPAATARAFGISVRQLHMLFEPSGTTFSRYVLARRLEWIRLALASAPRGTILDVAYGCGLQSSTVFYRAFRKAYGISPDQYRRSLCETPAPALQPALPDAGVANVPLVQASESAIVR
jgi:AraC-like DNA-binding protein